MAGGGTAGHLQPALAIAEALVDAGHGRDSIEFVGSARGQDRATLEGRGFPFTLLPGRGIVRSRRAADLWRNLGAVAGLAVAAVRAVGAGGPGPSPGGGLGRRLRQPAGLAGRRGARGSPGPGQRGCRARGGQPAVRAVRPGQRRRLAGEPAAPSGGHRHPGAPGDRRRRPAAPRPAGEARTGAGPARWTGPPWRCSAARSVPGASTRPWPVWSTAGRTGTTGRSTTSSGRRDWDERAGPGRAGPDGEAPARPGPRPGAGSPTRTGWTWSTGPPTWWCAGPGR